MIPISKNVIKIGALIVSIILFLGINIVFFR